MKKTEEMTRAVLAFVSEEPGSEAEGLAWVEFDRLVRDADHAAMRGALIELAVRVRLAERAVTT